MNRAIDTASAKQRRVSGIDDGFGSLFGDVGWASEFQRLAISED
jgi:hypothetical protein